LSTPTLSTLHSVSGAVLVAKYRLERVKDPREFDKTAEINRALTSAKIRRGGTNSLTQGDYAAELASREDAAKVEKGWNVEKSLYKITRMKARVEKKAKKCPNRKRRQQGIGSQ